MHEKIWQRGCLFEVDAEGHDHNFRVVEEVDEVEAHEFVILVGFHEKAVFIASEELVEGEQFLEVPDVEAVPNHVSGEDVNVALGEFMAELDLVPHVVSAMGAVAEALVRFPMEAEVEAVHVDMVVPVDIAGFKVGNVRQGLGGDDVQLFNGQFEKFLDTGGAVRRLIPETEKDDVGFSMVAKVDGEVTIEECGFVRGHGVEAEEMLTHVAFLLQLLFFSIYQILYGLM